MPKDAKGHGSNKRTWEVRQGSQTYTGLHSSYQTAKEAAHYHGLKNPDTVRLVESKKTQSENKKKAIAIGKLPRWGAQSRHGYMEATGNSPVRSTTKNGKY